MHGVFNTRLTLQQAGTALVASVTLAAGLLLVPAAAAAPTTGSKKNTAIASLQAHRTGTAVKSGGGGSDTADPAGRDINTVKLDLTQIQSIFASLIVHTDTPAEVTAQATPRTTEHTAQLNTTTTSVMTGVTGANVTFYPKANGYHNTFTPTVVLSAPRRLTLTIRNSHGVLRTIETDKAFGRQSLTWNGRNQANTLVPAGRYTWTLTASARNGSTQTTPSMNVTVSFKVLVNKSASVSKYGIDAWGAAASDTSCGTPDAKDSSFYPQGLWLLDACIDPNQLVVAFYRFTLPAAVQYRSIQLMTYGNTINVPTVLRGSARDPKTGNFALTGGAKVASINNSWYNLGTMNAAIYAAGGVVTTGVFVTTESGNTSDFDIGQVTLLVNYTVLQ